MKIKIFSDERKLRRFTELCPPEQHPTLPTTSTPHQEAYIYLNDTFKVMKGKKLQPRLLYPARISFRFDGEMKSFTNKS